MKYQVFVPILLLQFLNLFWYYRFILRVAIRCTLFPPYSEITSDNLIYTGPLSRRMPQTIGRTTRMTASQKLIRRMIEA
jgi:hypothetical protein